jgi:hypothetical protein
MTSKEHATKNKGDAGNILWLSKTRSRSLESPEIALKLTQVSADKKRDAPSGC